MSRYVDLEGVSWDGKPISSKIQEVQTKHGYMQGITIGWLWGDNVPHIDLEEHDKHIIEQYKVNTKLKNTIREIHDNVAQEMYCKGIDDFANWLVEQGILGNRCISDGEITDYGKVYAKKYKEQLKAGVNNE